MNRNHKTINPSPLAQERLLRFLVEGRRDLSEEAARCRMEKLGIHGLLPMVCVVEMSLHLDMYSPELVDELLLDVEEEAVRYLHRHGWRVCQYVDSRNSLILLMSSDAVGKYELLDQQLFKLADKLMSEYGIVIYVGIGRVVTNATQIKDSARDAETCIAYKYFSAGEHVIHIKNIRKLIADTAADHTTAFDRVIGCFLDGNMEKLQVRLTELLELLTASNNREQVIKQVYLELMAQLIRRTSDAGVELAEGQAGNDLQQILHMQNLLQLRQWFEQRCRELIAAISQKHQESSSYIAEVSKKYVEEHYRDHELSQQSVSDHMGLSVGYFGKLFYSQTGQRFLDYLNQYRLETAGKLLLSTNDKIKVISEQCGFNSVNYFNSLFKKHFHVTPKEYRHPKERQ